MGAGGGRIVNVSSRAALVPAGGALAYTAAKGALTAFTTALAHEVLKQGILVNAVAPSTIDTPANRVAMPAADHSHWARPEDIARTILWLASPANVLTWGAVVPVYG
jgi:NAD(P)-dependent dehydrogenase (short-subunit alcohol dehydrogenase family)